MIHLTQNDEGVLSALKKGTYSSPQVLRVKELGGSRVIFGAKEPGSKMPLYGKTLSDLSFDNPYLNMNFTIEAKEELTLTVWKNINVDGYELWYKRDSDYEWVQITNTDEDSYIELNAGETVMFKGSELEYSDFDYLLGFYSVDEHEVYGNLLSLVGKSEDNPDVEPCEHCFRGLFWEDEGLISAKDLVIPDTAPEYCYCKMFNMCYNLIDAPRELPALEAGYGCYESMFNACESLINPPVIKAKIFQPSSCRFMFNDCETMEYAPDLYIDSAYVDPDEEEIYEEGGETYITNDSGPFSKMYFNNNEMKSINIFVSEDAIVDNFSFKYMFTNCPNLSEVVCTLKNPSTSITEYWFDNVAPSGVFYKHPDAEWEYGNNGVPEGWEIVNYGEQPTDWSQEYLQIIAHNGYATLYLEAMTSYGETVMNHLEAKINDGEWFRVFDENTYETTPIELESNDVVYLKGDGFYHDIEMGYLSCNNWFSCDTESDDTYLEVKGNLMSLIYGDDFVGENTIKEIEYEDEVHIPTYFGGLFSYLPIKFAGNLYLPNCGVDGLYACMFKGCDILVYAPKLPKTIMYPASYYMAMFQGCESLISAPYISKGTAHRDAFASMFYGCSNLYYVQDEINIDCYPEEQSIFGCFYDMFGYCTSLETAPLLSTKKLSDYCYYYMFYGCTMLCDMPVKLPATTLAVGCYDSMFYGCSNLGYAPELPSEYLEEGCYRNMFYECYNLYESPKLPAEWLADECYKNMFYGCYNLEYVECLATHNDAENSTLNWLHGVASNGTFRKSADAEFWETGASGIPEGWREVFNSYTVVLNNQWELNQSINPDSETYDGAYQSYSNRGVDGGMATMDIIINGFETFGLYIRSNAESYYDYVIVSQLDGQVPTGWDSDICEDYTYTYPDAHTCGRQSSDTSIEGYIYVEFNNIDGGEHVIHITYGKDGSAESNDDRGYVLIPIEQ